MHEMGTKPLKHSAELAVQSFCSITILPSHSISRAAIMQLQSTIGADPESHFHMVGDSASRGLSWSLVVKKPPPTLILLSIIHHRGNRGPSAINTAEPGSAALLSFVIDPIQNRSHGQGTILLVCCAQAVENTKNSSHPLRLGVASFHRCSRSLRHFPAQSIPHQVLARGK